MIIYELRLTSCWQPAFSRTHHMSFCFLPRTLPVPPETTLPDSTGSSKSTTQKCRKDNASRGDPQPTGARGWLVTVSVLGPAIDNFQCYCQWDRAPLPHGSDSLNSSHDAFPSFPAPVFCSAPWEYLSHKLPAHKTWPQALLFRVTISMGEDVSPSP